MSEPDQNPHCEARAGLAAATTCSNPEQEPYIEEEDLSNGLG